jgi:hypothetical protein
MCRAPRREPHHLAGERRMDVRARAHRRDVLAAGGVAELLKDRPPFCLQHGDFLPQRVHLPYGARDRCLCGGIGHRSFRLRSRGRAHTVEQACDRLDQGIQLERFF